MFRHYSVILREPVINALVSYTSILIADFSVLPTDACKILL